MIFIGDVKYEIRSPRLYRSICISKRIEFRFSVMNLRWSIELGVSITDVCQCLLFKVFLRGDSFT